ncbi:MAG: DUF4340 domain-containing protein [Magnetococcales bacterium]|nr:DUF4340 domain-containing protein [Magnetococcales bacterium]
MSKGWLTNIVLLLFIGGAGAGLWWMDRQESSEKAQEEASRVLSTLKADEISLLSFQDEEGDEISMEKSDAGWKINQPRSYITDQDAVAETLRIVTKSYQRHVTDTPADLSIFGMEKPVAKLVLTGKEKQQTFILGSSSPTSGNRYLRLDAEGPVVLVPKAVADSMMRKVDAFRQKKIITGLTAKDITRLVRTSTRSPESDMVISGNSTEGWQLTGPITDKVGANRFTSWIDQLLLGRGSGFSESLTDTPHWTLEVTWKSGENEQKQTLKFWNPDQKQLLVQRPGEADSLELYSYMLKDLDKEPLTLLDHRPFALSSSITGLKLTAGDQTHEASFVDKWPDPSWNTLADLLKEEGWNTRLTAPVTDPLVVLTATVDGNQVEIPVTKESNTFILALPNRPVHISLTRIQSEQFQDILQNLLPEQFKPKQEALEQPQSDIPSPE